LPARRLTRRDAPSPTRIAQAQIERVRGARRALLAQAGDDPGATVRLSAIDDYERRARSQRRSAMRAFDDDAPGLAEPDVAGKQTPTCQTSMFTSREAPHRRLTDRLKGWPKS
jgi:hypothetical protein